MRTARRNSEQRGAQSAGRPRSSSRAEPGPERRVPAPAAMLAGRAARTCALLALCLLGSGAQDFGPTRFICTSVPVDTDMCAASVAAGGAEELRSNVLQLRETVLQQKETILSQKETIRELTTKLGRCESQSTLDASAGEARTGGGRKQPGSGKNTMGDLSRTPAAETLSQLGQTLQSLKTRLENLEVRARRCFPSGSRAPLPSPTSIPDPARHPQPRPWPGADAWLGPPQACGAPRTATRPSSPPGCPRSRPEGTAPPASRHGPCSTRNDMVSPPSHPCTLAAVQPAQFLQPDQQPQGSAAEQDR